MKCIILCGGQSLRMRFDMPDTPKVLAIIEDKPLLHHIIEYYHSQHVFDEYVLCLGYYKEAIIRSFVNAANGTDIDKIIWNGINIHFLNTGMDSTATYRIKKATEYIEESHFFVSYADVVGNFDLQNMLVFHSKNCASITVALAKTKMPYGHAALGTDDSITSFIEKPVSDFWINAGIFIVQKKVFLSADGNMEFEREFLPYCIDQGNKMFGYKHFEYWRGVDTYKDLVAITNEWTEVKKHFF